MKSDIELKAIAFDSFIRAAESKNASAGMMSAAMTLNSIYAIEKSKKLVEGTLPATKPYPISEG